jgi:hypothetical protein
VGVHDSIITTTPPRHREILLVPYGTVLSKYSTVVSFRAETFSRVTEAKPHSMGRIMKTPERLKLRGLHLSAPDFAHLCRSVCHFCMILLEEKEDKTRRKKPAFRIDCSIIAY